MATYLQLEWPVSMCVPLAIGSLLECELLSCNPPSHFIYRENESSPVLLRGIFNDQKRVKDDDRFRIVGAEGEWSLLNRDGSTPVQESACSSPESEFVGESAVVLLESPHKDEFTCDFVPKGPAMGATGKNIRCGLAGAISRSEPILGQLSSGTRVIIANPVQFQCSLRVIHRNRSVPSCRRLELKDSVWQAIWSVDEVRSEFIQRIRTYQPTKILNLCTKSNNKSGDVTQELRQAGFQNNVFVGPHPSSPNWVNQAAFVRP